MGNEVPGQAVVQYLGVPGCTKECVNAIAQLIQAGPDIEAVRILTSADGPETVHAFLITCAPGDWIIIPSGFSSGYVGEGPNGFSFVLALFQSLGLSVDEVRVAEEIFERIDQIALSDEDIESIVHARPRQPSTWNGYISEQDEEAAHEGTLWQNLEPFIPLSAVERELGDLAISFWRAPSSNLMTAFRRLEAKVRAEVEDITGEEARELSGSRLFSKAFQGNSSVLTWNGLPEGERTGLGNLFTAAYMGFRNRRAHREESDEEPVDFLREFLLINLLFGLLRKASPR